MMKAPSNNKTEIRAPQVRTGPAGPPRPSGPPPARRTESGPARPGPAQGCGAVRGGAERCGEPPRAGRQRPAKEGRAPSCVI